MIIRLEEKKMSGTTKKERRRTGKSNHQDIVHCFLKKSKEKITELKKLIFLFT